MWGQVLGAVSTAGDLRIIPMRVGTSLTPLSHCDVTQGSSPCVWGQVLDAWNTYKNDRIIPMRVGTSILALAGWDAAEDHPHACGDKHLLTPPYVAGAGSSPCVWGQVPSDTLDGYKPGIIPMRVGTRAVMSLRQKFCRDHPHACGDK